MEAPAGGSTLDSVNDRIIAHVTANYEHDAENNRYSCKTCKAAIQQTTCFVSVHTKLFGMACAGSGEVRQVPLPYCLNCEGKPKRVSTCIHE